MIIRQVKVGMMEVFCYILGCQETHKGLLIDPAGDEDLILETAQSLGLTVESIVNTHGHPDHTCGNRKIKDETGAKVYMHPEDDRIFNSPQGETMAMQMGFAPSPPADVLVKDGDIIPLGTHELRVIHTPGHSPGGICLHWDNNLFTGDTLFVGAVGRTDLPGGSLQTMLDSIKEKILTLPDETIVWPGHNYGGSPTSTIALEKKHNIYVTDFELV